jgi:HSP20 family protein
MDPFTDLGNLRSAIDQVFGDFMDRTSTTPSYAGVFPALNITENGDNLYLRAELPGIDPKQLNISATTDSIAIRGECKVTPVNEGVNYHQRERNYGTFRRIINLPTAISTDRITASYKDGVLTVVLPKAEETKPKQIEIKTA